MYSQSGNAGVLFQSQSGNFAGTKICARGRANKDVASVTSDRSTTCSFLVSYISQRLSPVLPLTLVPRLMVELPQMLEPLPTLGLLQLL